MQSTARNVPTALSISITCSGNITNMCDGHYNPADAPSHKESLDRTPTLPDIQSKASELYKCMAK